MAALARRAVSALAVAVATALPAMAEGPKPGAYEVGFSLELPHIPPVAGGAATVCVVDPASKGFVVLSANNPLANCPASDVRSDGGALSFRIACPGPNAAKAEALYDTHAEAFEGRIAMNMGGKNMTMTEIQHGRRIGDCAAEAPPPTSRP